MSFCALVCITDREFCVFVSNRFDMIEATIPTESTPSPGPPVPQSRGSPFWIFFVQMKTFRSGREAGIMAVHFNFFKRTAIWACAILLLAWNPNLGGDSIGGWQSIGAGFSYHSSSDLFTPGLGFRLGTCDALFMLIETLYMKGALWLLTCAWLMVGLHQLHVASQKVLRSCQPFTKHKSLSMHLCICMHACA